MAETCADLYEINSETRLIIILRAPTRLKWLFAWRLQCFFQSDKFNLPVIKRRGYKAADKTEQSFFIIIIIFLFQRHLRLSWLLAYSPSHEEKSACILRVWSEACKRSDPVCCSLELPAVAYIRPDTVSQEPPRLNHPFLKIPIRHFQVPGRSFWQQLSAH